ncbi:hypothetical protein C038_03109 [Brucella sp. 63/311]|nr:hypothetical protein C038_03109 [Brucella sp. 63/311]
MKGGKRHCGRGVAAKRLQKESVFHLRGTCRRISVERQEKKIAVRNRKDLFGVYKARSARIGLADECFAIRQFDKGFWMCIPRKRPKP